MSDSTFASNGPFINTVPQSDAGIPAGAEPMGDQKAPLPKPSGVRDAAVTIAKSTTVGLGGSAAYAFVMHLIDPTDPSARMSGLVGVVLGGLSGLNDLQAKRYQNKLRADVEYRRAMIEAEREPNLQRAIESERHHEECKAEREALRVTIADQGRKIEKLETSIEVERKRADGLTEMVVSLSERLNKVEAIRREAERRGDTENERLAGGG